MQSKIVFDFDGTLISRNSFPLWVVFLLFQSIASFEGGRLTKILLLLFRRKITKRIDHNELKLRLISMPVPECWDEAFARGLVKYSRESVVEQALQHLNNGECVVVSSAAPFRYLSKAVKLMFPEVHGQVLTLGATVELGRLNDNYKENKLSNIYRFGVISPEEKLKVLYTDSWDDRFLAEAAERVILVQPLSTDVQRFMADPLFNKKTYLFSQLK